MIHFFRCLPTPQSQEHSIRRHQLGYHLEATNRPRISQPQVPHHLPASEKPTLHHTTLSNRAERLALPCLPLNPLQAAYIRHGRSYKTACTPTAEPSCLGPLVGRWMACVVSGVVIGDLRFWRCCCVGCNEASREFPRGWVDSEGWEGRGTGRGGANEESKGPRPRRGPAEVAFLRFRDLVS